MSELNKLMEKLKKGEKLKEEKKQEDTKKKQAPPMDEDEEDDSKLPPEEEFDDEDDEKPEGQIEDDIENINPKEHTVVAEIGLLQNNGIYRRERLLVAKEQVDVLKIIAETLLDLKKHLIGENGKSK